jgi:hypothetical protein
MSKIFTLSIFSIALTIGNFARSQDLPQRRKVVIEFVTEVFVTKFKMPLKVLKISKAQSNYTSPELSTTTQFSAMSEQNYDWWLEGWSSEARSQMETRNRETGRTPTTITQNWKGLLTEQSVEMVGKADYQRLGIQYALIRYRLSTDNLQAVDLTTKKATPLNSKFFENTMSFRLLNGKWIAVQELADDPVFANSDRLWSDENADIRIVRQGTSGLR